MIAGVARLGHGSGATTPKVYAGWVNEADRRAADTMATIVPRPIPAPAAPRGPYEVIAEALRGRSAPASSSQAINCRRPPSSQSRTRWPSELPPCPRPASWRADPTRGRPADPAQLSQLLTQAGRQRGVDAEA
jgi:hypothetical protein